MCRASTYTTGVLDAHEVGLMADGRIVFVNTAYNCLAVPSERHSFTAFWMPPFISGLVDGRSLPSQWPRDGAGHGRAMSPRCRAPTRIDGWRDRRADGGVVIDVATGGGGLRRAFHAAFAAPAQWRSLGSQLGPARTRHRGFTDGRRNGQISAGCFLPRLPARTGHFAAGYAFVGLSKPRYQRFEGLALDGAPHGSGGFGTLVRHPGHRHRESSVASIGSASTEQVAEIFDVAVLAWRRLSRCHWVSRRTRSGRSSPMRG